MRKDILKKLLIACLLISLSYFSGYAAKAQGLPVLNPRHSPLSRENKYLLKSRLQKAFDYHYSQKGNLTDRNFSDDFSIYYLRQELQALVDMYYATSDKKYIITAKETVLKAIRDAEQNRQALNYYKQPRGTWPCFFHKAVLKATGGHSQLNDFQGAAGFLMVAKTLKDNNLDGWQKIADFVQDQIIKKWLNYKPPLQSIDFKKEEDVSKLLSVLDSARDKREHFACICLDLDDLGYRNYPYRKWAEFLIRIYLTERPGLSSPFPDPEIQKIVPKDWGLVRQEDGTLIWHWTLKKIFTVPQDTSHANRTVWLATKAYEKKLIPETSLRGLILTFKKNVWAPEKGPFYFNNYIDGSDKPVQGLGPGRKGNLWFGWHHLGAYDDSLKDLFISMAYDLTNDGKHFPKLAQNVRMENAPLCFYAWGTRLLAEDGQVEIVP